MRISDWSSDVCSSDLQTQGGFRPGRGQPAPSMAEGRWPCGPDRRTQRHLRAFDLFRENVPARKARPSLDVGLTETFSARSEERRVGKECVSPCRSRWAPYPEKKKTTTEHREQE